MDWFPFLTTVHSIVFVLYFYLAGLLLYYNYKSNLNRIAFCLLMCFAIWSFVKIFSHNINTPKNIVLALENYFSFSWILIPAFAFYFFATLTNKDYLLKDKKILFLIIAFTGLFYFQVITGNIFKDMELKDYGWFRPWKNNIWIILFYVYFIVCMLFGLYFLIKNYLKIKNKIKKIILEKFVLASIGTFILCLTIELLEILFYKLELKKSFLEDIPNMYLIIFALALMYLQSKYKFMKISPIYAAETIISSINESLIITDDEINIVYMNENAIKTFVSHTNAHDNKQFIDLFKNKKDINHLLKDVIKNGFIRNFETEFNTLDNKSIPVLISAAVIQELGEMIGIVFIVSDITEFKEAQKSLKESYERLVEADILKTTFISMVSHELRTPLTTILGFLSLILGGATGKVPDYLKEYLEIMKNNSERLLALINDLLDLSKLESCTFNIVKKDVDIIKLINEVIQNLKPVCIKKNITIFFDSTLKTSTINIDPMRISQALTNLINNAIKFSKNNSKISIVAYTKNKNDIKAPENIGDINLNFNTYMVVKIIDEGAGIAPHLLTKIFDKFFQAEDINTRKSQGVGLGLYIAKEIVLMHDGYIWAESEGNGKGSAFTILLPLD